MATCKYILKQGNFKGSPCSLPVVKTKLKVLAVNGGEYVEVEVAEDYCKRHFNVVMDGYGYRD
jgi:TusA-related sulfurtransferase